MRQLQLLIPVLFIIGLSSSCVSHEELLNFNQGEAFPDTAVAMGVIPDLRIQPDDIISVRVKTMDEEAAIPFNIHQDNRNFNIRTESNNRLIGHLVNKNGYIDFPILGEIQVAGMTTDEAKDAIKEKLKTYLKDPTVIVRFLNFRITVLGEVNIPGTYTMPDERVTILDAVGTAGDIGPYGNRTNVLLIREYDGQREYAHLNLQDRNIFQSPYFYLLQNDVVYVEPLEEKTSQIRDQSQRILPWVSVVSTLTTLVVAITKL